MEEEEDRALLDSLGITSVKPEELERNILAEAINAAENASEAGKGIDDEIPEKIKTSQSSLAGKEKLFGKLRAIQFEIDAVASTVKPSKKDVRSTMHDGDNDDSMAQDDIKGKKGAFQDSSGDVTLQHALASDRLRSLKKAKAQLKNEIAGQSEGAEHDKLIQDLDKEERRHKNRLKEVQKNGKAMQKKQKVVDDDLDFDAILDAASAGFVETERDELVRKGILTPFHKLKGYERRIQPSRFSDRQNVHPEVNLPDDFESVSINKAIKSMEEAAKSRPTTMLLGPEALPKLDPPTHPFRRLRKIYKRPITSDEEADKNGEAKRKRRRPLPGKKWKKINSKEELSEENEPSENGQHDMTSSCDEQNQDNEDLDGDESTSVTLEGGLRVPEIIFDKLFDYQKVGVQWLWELHCQKAGGIIGDEMGLGKTIQVLSFLAALHFSGMYKPSIIVCPVTLLRQWSREAKKWYPSFHVELLHDSAIELCRKKRSKSSESDYDSEDSICSDGDTEVKISSKNPRKWDSLINRVLKSTSGMLITTYEQLRLLGDKLLDIEWGYAVLDEGHRIRNPNADITLVCKQLQTVHRIIMTGAPIQNKLTELWSLFDFVFPGKLGVLPVFEAEFSVPISVGGYANASPLQVSTAYRCAVVLRDLIMPYLLRRMKADVNAQLPKKTEHVLFCSLTDEQRSAYRAFLASSDVEQIFEGNRNSLYGIDVMRKICNHPDLLEREHACNNPDYGNPERSGKMKVVSQVLKVWKEQGHRVLFFTQTQQMLDIFENFLITGGYSYRRMDGLTPVRQRMVLIDEFNNSDDIFIFILTTKVGGLGTNLTGANRVIIFDPDWNPSTDMQARERAWRIGQKKDVTIYRLITRGTIEEKVYHRQIYKQFLTNKILKNPQQKRFFKARDMKDLFTLTDDGDNQSTETSNIFGQLSESISVVGSHTETRDQQVGSSYAGEEKSTQSNPSKNKGKGKVDQNGEGDEETGILKSLFDANGIHSAMNHDAIMNANGEEKMRLEEEASQVARRAAEALRQSRMLRSQESVSVPTWTGKSGAAGAPSSFRQKFGSTVVTRVTYSKTSEESSEQYGVAAGTSAGKALSSAELLAKIRSTQEQAINDGIRGPLTSINFTSTSRSSLNSSSMQPEIVIRQICTFIQQKGGGRASSSDIVDHFKDRIPGKDLPLFKSLLKEIATLVKDSSGSSWILKPGYQ
ncbi:unnamed protein product [Rhodiola kirilowii]